MSKPSTALLIAGMHRSGTSFLGESCGALGFTLPHDAGGPARDNPRGHFEPRAVVALNDAILSERGAFWLRVGPLDLPAPDEALLARMDAAVAESFGDASRIMVKDPRLSLTLPLWRVWLEARGIEAASARMASRMRSGSTTKPRVRTPATRRSTWASSKAMRPFRASAVSNSPSPSSRPRSGADATLFED